MNIGIAGLGTIGIIPFSCESLEEIAFPVQENISINTFMWVATLLSFIMTDISTWTLLGDYGSYSKTKRIIILFCRSRNNLFFGKSN